MSRARAFAKINLALVVGSRRADGKHEVVTVLQRIDLHDTITVEPADALVVEGFAEDTIVRDALRALGEAAGQEPRWRVGIEKRIPASAGLGGGSSDAATALSLANASLERPLSAAELDALGARVGADVPFFFRDGPQLGTGDGTVLEPLDLPMDYTVLLLVPAAEVKASTREVYAAFDARGGADGFAGRVSALVAALSSVTTVGELAALPHNDLASSPLAVELVASGAIRADVSGAGPTVYGLFEDREAAASAAEAVSGAGAVSIVRPVEAGDRP